MADVSRSVYLSRKLSSVNEESSKHIYDGIFSAPAAAAKRNDSNFAARIDDYREIFPPSKASLGSSIPILDLPAVDRSVGPGRALSSGFDYASVFGGFGDNDGIEVPSEKLFSDLRKTAKRDAQLLRIPAQTRRMPSKSQEFSCNYGNDQASSPVPTRRMPSKSQEFSCNYGNDQTSNPVQTRRMSSKNQDFSCDYGNDQTSSVQTRTMPSKSREFSCNNVDQTFSPAKTRRVPSKSQEFSCNFGSDQTSSPAQPRRMPSKSQEFSCNNGNDQASSPVQPRRMPSKSQEFSCNYGNGQTSSPVQPRRIPSKSQEFSCNNGNDQTSPAQTRMQHSKSQEFSSNVSNNKMSTDPVQTRRPFSTDNQISSTSPNDQTSASASPHQTVDNVKHVSVSYHKSNQFSKDCTNGMTHIARLHAVPGYTLLFDEAGPVRKPGFDKAKRLSMDDADFSGAVGKVSRQGKHTRAVSDLGTNQQASDHDPQTHSISVSNSPQSFGSSGYFKKSSSRRPKSFKNKQGKNASGDSSLLLEEELDVNSSAAISAAAMKRAIEEAEEKMRWAKEFLRELECNGFIKPTLKDSFKVKVRNDAYHSCETYGPKQNSGLKVKATRQKKLLNEEKILKQNRYLNSKASGEIKLKADSEITSQSQLENEAAVQKLHVLAAGVNTTMRSPAPETLIERNAHDELKLDEKSSRHEGGGEWEAAKQLSQLFTGVKNRFVSFMSKHADTEKTVRKNAPSKCEYLEQSEERTHEVQHVNTNQERKVDLKHTEEKVEMNHSTCPVVGESAQKTCEAKENEVNTSASTSSPDIETLISKQCGPSEPKEELGYVEVQESANRTNDLNQDVSTEVKAELSQEVREQNQEILDGTMKIEHDSRMGTIGIEERDEIPEKACQLHACDLINNREDDEDTVNEVPGLEPVEKRVGESLNDEVVISGQIEGSNLKETEMPKDVQMKQEEDVRKTEETRMVEECYKRGVETEEIYGGGEDTERITIQDVTSEATEDRIEVVDDVSEHDEHRSATDGMSEQNEIFMTENEDASMPDRTNQSVPGLKFSSEEKGRMAESAAGPFEPEEVVEQPRSVQRASDLIGEGIFEQTPCSIEAVDDDSDHNEYLPAVDDILEQGDFLSSSRNEEASVHEISRQDALDVDLSSQKERLTEATSTNTFEPEGNIEKSRPVQMDDKLNGEYMSEDSGSHSEAADELLEQDDYLPAVDDVCEKKEHSCVIRNVETSQEGKFSVEEDRMTTSGDRLDLDNTEKDIEEAHEASPCTNVEITECDTVLKYEQKHSNEESMNVATDIDPENQDDESELGTREASEANNGESSHKRRRWFENKKEVELPGIFTGNERTLELDQENAEGITVEDRVESCVDEIAKDSDKSAHMEQADAGSDQDEEGEGLHTHRRRRWFENRSEKVECKASTEAGHRRRRWFEKRDKSETTKQEEEIKQELHEKTSIEEELANTHQSEGQSKEREKEKERQAVERAIREVRQRAFAEARERAAAEARVKAVAQDRPVKASSEATPTLSEKASMDAKLRAERAAVERATAEARERALQKSMSEKVTYKSREKDFKNLNSGPSSSSGYSTSVPFTSDRPNGAMTESPQRRKAISERNKRTTERAAKALEEKNMRDVLVQKEQAERTRFAGVLDAEVKRWSIGKEGNLRSLLSTLQYVLGPDSGWQPIPLTDLVTTAAVRKAYKRAALCVHPDKLQQRRATVQQKYICEKVFDLLKDGWHKFNPDDR